MIEPDLHTPDYRLRPMAPSDRAFYVALFTDPQVMRWVGPPFTPATAARAFDAAWPHNLATRPGHRFWIIETRALQAIGLAALKRTGPDGELGAMVIPEWWNRGVSRQAFRAIACAAFDRMGLDGLDVRRPSDPQALVVNRMLAAVGFAAPTAMDDGSLHWRLTAAELIRD